MSTGSPRIVFYAWQSDSPRDTNLNLINEALESAAEIISREDSTPVVIDRDTRGVGGSPCVVDTILKKIKKCDVFLWDATLVYDSPKPAPNPNVVLEYGYALAVLGEGRMIAIMNLAGDRSPKELPFDFKGTRRWPIHYSLSAGDKKFEKKSKRIVHHLTKMFVSAIRAALKEPRTGALQNDVDFYIARRFWSIIDSTWLINWSGARLQTIQFDKATYRRKLEDYLYESEKSENTFLDETLLALHTEVINAINESLTAGAYEMVPADASCDVYVIGAKARYNKVGFFDGYDDQYEKEISRLSESVKKVIAAWEPYVKALRQKYPELTHASE